MTASAPLALTAKQAARKLAERVTVFDCLASYVCTSDKFDAGSLNSSQLTDSGRCSAMFYNGDIRRVATSTCDSDTERRMITTLRTATESSTCREFHP